MNKFLKWGLFSLLLFVIVIVSLSLLAPRDTLGNNLWLVRLKLKIEPELTITYIKSAQPSIELFKIDKEKLPVTLTELRDYNPFIDEMLQLSLEYTKENDNAYKLCGPYFSKLTNIANTETEIWTLDQNKVCFEKRNK